MRLIRSLRARAADEGGFTMALVMISLMVIISASAAAVAATQGDVRGGGDALSWSGCSPRRCSLPDV